MSARVFVCYASADAAYRDDLVRQLSTYERNGFLEAVVDVRIEAGSDWRAVLAAELDRCAVAVLLVSLHLINSEFVGDVELPRIEQRWREGRLLPVRVDVGASSDDPRIVPAFLTKVQWPLRGWDRISALTDDRRNEAWCRVGTTVADAAAAAPRALTWVATAGLSQHALVNEFRRLAPPGTPRPPYENTVSGAAWSLAMKLAALAARRGTSQPAALAAAPVRPRVRLVLEPIPGSPGWSASAWCRDEVGLRQLPPEPRVLQEADVPGWVGEVFASADCPLHTALDRLEVVCDVLARDWDLRGVTIHDPELDDSSPLGAAVVHRAVQRVRSPKLADALRMRASAAWQGGAPAGVGPGGPGCIAAAQCHPPPIDEATLRERIAPSAAVCLALPGLADAHRRKLLAEALRQGLPVVLWTADAPDDAELRALLGSTPVRDLPGAVSHAKLRAKVLFDDPDDPIPPDHLTSPS